jgi:hypothetical protein
MPSSTILSPYAFRSPETAIAEVLMRPLSAAGLTRPCHAPDTATASLTLSSVMRSGPLQGYAGAGRQIRTVTPRPVRKNQMIVT